LAFGVYKMSKVNILLRRMAPMWMLLFTALPGSAWAADSYRWFHVTIETPWAIFIFLLPMVLTPLVLMAILYWRFAGRSDEEKNRGRGSRKTEKTESSPR